MSEIREYSFVNPTPGVKWMNTERKTLLDRRPADTVLALAFIHHLTIASNLPYLRGLRR